MKNRLRAIIRWPFVSMINLYQHTLSFDHGPMKSLFPHGYCRYSPSCSEFSKQAIIKHGVFKGIILGTWRILRCNPWSKGGNDKVPDRFTFKKNSTNAK